MAKQSFSTQCELPADADTCYALLTNKDYLANKYGTAEKPVNVSVTADAEGHKVVVERELEIKDPPAIVKAFVKDVMTLRLEQHWRKTTKGYTATINYALVDTPAFIDGQLTLNSQQSSTQLLADLQAHVNVPIIGGKGSKLLAEGAEKRLKKDFEANIEALS